MERALAFMYLCNGPQWGFHWLAANSRGMARATPAEQKEAGVGRSYKVLYKKMVILPPFRIS